MQDVASHSVAYQKYSGFFVDKMEIYEPIAWPSKILRLTRRMGVFLWNKLYIKLCHKS